MAQAREVLAQKWTACAGGAAIYLVAIFAVQSLPLLGPIVGLIVFGPATLGFSLFFLQLHRSGETDLSLLLKGFDRFNVGIIAHILQVLFVTLWACLLIIPGVIAWCSYSMTYYILAEDETLTPLEAITRSKQMMQGYKWKLAAMYVRSSGWYVLCLLTSGIGFLWYLPYIEASRIQLYHDIKAQQANPIEAPIEEGE